MFSSVSFAKDFKSGIVVFLVALPLCLGIALASGAPLFSGLLAGIIGGIVVGSVSGSHTSVSGPAAGLTAIVSMQIAKLGSFEAFLFAVFIAGFIQVGLGMARAGAISAFVPSSVIKGLLAAIGVILILKQIPHVLGHDTDPEGEMAFEQPDHETTFSELGTLINGEVHYGAIVIGLTSIALLVLWDKWKPLKRSFVPGPLVVVLLGVGVNMIFRQMGSPWFIGESHLVQIPVADTMRDMLSFLRPPDFSQWSNASAYIAAVTIAIVASLETLLNLEAVDKLDPQQRDSPPSRELVAQGCGNIVAGLVGALPMTSVIVRSSVNVDTGAASKLSAIVHGILLLSSVVLLPVYLNMIPLAALAAILLVTGFKLASPKLFRQMWKEGRYQFLPFLVTLVAIVFTDLLIGILIGLAISALFILNANLRRPIRRIAETHLSGDILHIVLANQVSFLNRAALGRTLSEAPRGTHVLLDARDTDFIDPDILGLIREFKHVKAPAHGVTVSLRGFRKKYDLDDEIQFADFSTRELRDRSTPQQVLEILKEGNQRFLTGTRLSRDFNRQINATAHGQNPMAVVLSCIDSRVPVEVVFDMGIGDLFSVRVAGNVLGTRALGGIEFGVAVAGVKLVLVMGHTRCGAVTESIRLLRAGQDATEATGCKHLTLIVDDVQACLERDECPDEGSGSHAEEAFIDEIARRNVLRTVDAIVERSEAVRKAVEQGQVMVVGALYDVKTGEISFLTHGEASGAMHS